MAAAGGRLSPMADVANHVLSWPSALSDIKRFVTGLYKDVEDRRSLCLEWGEMESAVPTYAALGLPGAFTVWFIDLRSLEALLEHWAELAAASGQAPPVTKARVLVADSTELDPILAALPRDVPGITFELEATSVDRVARALAMEVVALERAGVSHARCLAMMLRSSRSELSPPRSSDLPCASTSSSTERSRRSSRGPGSKPGPVAGSR